MDSDKAGFIKELVRAGAPEDPEGSAVTRPFPWGVQAGRGVGGPAE